MLETINAKQNATRVPITDSSGYYTGTTVEAALQEIGDAGLFVSQIRTLYVGKHGNDSNSGVTVSKAFLTIGAAITAASALTPTEAAPVVLRISDAGVYAENIVVPAWVRIHGPNAEVEGTGGAAAITLTTGSSIVLARVEQANAGQSAISRLDTVGTAWVDVGRIELAGNATGVLNLAIVNPGVLFLRCNTILVDTGFGVGDVSNSTGHMHVDVGDIYLSGNGATAIARIGTNSTVGKIDHILEEGTPTGTTGISVGNGSMDLFVSTIVADTSWTVALGATLNLHVGSVAGTPSVTGTANVVESSEIETHLNDATIHYAVSSIDHGSINASSLLDDDHTHYLLADGTRDMSGALAFTSGSVLNGLTDGNFLLTDDAGTAFSLLQFGGTTVSYPAIKRNTTRFDLRLANDSAYARLASGHIGISDAPTDTHLLFGSEGFVGGSGNRIGIGIFPAYVPDTTDANSLYGVQGNIFFGNASWGANSNVNALQFFPAPDYTFGSTSWGSANLNLIGITTGAMINIFSRTVTANELIGLGVSTLSHIFGTPGAVTANAAVAVRVLSPSQTTGTIALQTGIEILPQLYGTVNQGLWLNGNAAGTDIILGSGKNARVFYNGTNLIINPAFSGSGRVLIGATGNRNMLLNNIEIDGALDHDGSTIGFYSTTPITKPTVTGAKGGNVALTNLLTALANLGLLTNSTT